MNEVFLVLESYVEVTKNSIVSKGLLIVVGKKIDVLQNLQEDLICMLTSRAYWLWDT